MKRWKRSRASRARTWSIPAAYFFHRAVTEHALMMKEQADDSIDRLLIDVVDAPARYRMVGVLMHYDMVTWQDKDLDWIARKMGVIKDRLDLTRGGPKTRSMQREVLVKLDEKIKELENKMKGSCQCNGGGCPSGGSANGPPNGNRPSNPAGDFGLPSGVAKGEIDVEEVQGVRRRVGQAARKGARQGHDRTDTWDARQVPRRHRVLLQTTGESGQVRAASTSHFRSAACGLALPYR